MMALVFVSTVLSVDVTAQSTPVVTEDGFIAITDPDIVIAESMPAKPAYRGRVVV